MKSSRRNFLAAGLALPGLSSASLNTQSAVPPKAPEVKGSGVEYRTLGKTGLKVSSVGFGCMITSDPTVIEKALDLGVNYFDTARVYQQGNNERMVGAALKSRRKEIFLSSKSVAGNQRDALVDLKTSLDELKTDYLDIWYLHSKSSPQDINEGLIAAQEVAKKNGQIRYAGISFHAGHSQVIPYIIKRNHCDVILLSYNFAMGNSVDALIQQAKDAGLGVVAMKVMAGGLRRTSFYPIPNQVHSMLKREGVMSAALKWVLAHRNIDTTIPSMVDMDQLDENFKAMASELSESDVKVLTAHLEKISPEFCRMCDSCKGTCPQGLPVADVLRYLMYAESYGQFSLGRESFKMLPKEVANVRCQLCPECSVSCPNGVKVAERLTRAQELFA